MALSPIEDETLKDLDYILGVINLKQLREIASFLDQVKKKKHGTVYLIVKNGELNFVDVRLSVNVRRF